jgi:cellulose synthase/poly-beta-1,6-N-acetylglucosamine synthase-like glycosyltransferase
MAWRELTRHLREREYSPTDDAMASPLTAPISILLPAYNEEAGVVESVKSLLSLRYPEHEVVVVNDGSKDSTLERLKENFELVPIRIALRDSIAHKEVRGTYVSRRDPRLIVIDKENGGKADALNCGICAASYPYVCSIDGDTLVEEDALLRVAKPALDDPERVVATGGIVRIVNGCVVDHGKVVDVRLPKSRIATFQVIEYFRAFLVGRVAWSRIRALLIISGAFGLFRRSVVEAAGGYAVDMIGEDAELVVRIHRYMRNRKQDYRIEFVPDPVSWTEAPEDLGSLGRQRRRWQRGLASTLWRHRSMIGNPRYRAFGLLALPYFVIFEAAGPVISLLGVFLIPLGAIFGFLSVGYLVAFALVAFALGGLLSIAALTLEEFSFRRHARHREAARLFLYGLIDNLGYRQLNDWFRFRGMIDHARGKKGWGEMARKGFATEAEVAVESEVPVGRG